MLIHQILLHITKKFIFSRNYIIYKSELYNAYHDFYLEKFSKKWFKILQFLSFMVYWHCDDI